MTRYIPKTLAKTLSYIACYAPWEYGLFWGPDGTMPWKELYWALQEDDSLRFVRESHIREIEFLGLPLPFSIDGSLLRLKDVHSPVYPAVIPPERLYYACRRKQHAFIVQHGLDAANSSRPFLAFAVDRELALRIGKRRDPQPVLIECLCKKAVADGVLFRRVGAELYLIQSLASEHLLCPPVREGLLSRPAAKSAEKRRTSQKEQLPTSPGSFLVDLSGLADPSHRGTTGTPSKRKGRGGPDWKREARKDRHKRGF
jgi:putative RNA 2'-phosphotransferase